MVYTKYDKHWYGSSYSKLKRNACGSLDWTITGWYDMNQIYATCTKCGQNVIATIDTH